MSEHVSKMHSLHISHHNKQHPLFFLCCSFALSVTFYGCQHFALSPFSCSLSTVGDTRRKYMQLNTDRQHCICVFHEENRLCELFMHSPEQSKNIQGICCDSFWNESVATLKCFILHTLSSGPLGIKPPLVTFFGQLHSSKVSHQQQKWTPILQ